MASFTWAVAFLGCVLQSMALPSIPRGNPTYKSHPDRANAVIEIFDRAWAGYYEYAFPHDSLMPVSRGYTDDRNGWGASAVDALSTALVMRDINVVKQIVEYIPIIDFATTNTTVSLFETTIRYLGGLLSAHDLLTGPLSDLVSYDANLVDDILKQAVTLADLLSVGFDTPSGVPINDLLFEPPRVENDTTNGIATIGTLVLEWTRLSDKTGNTTYAELAQRGEAFLLNPQPKEIGEPYPGLIGTNVYVSNGSFADSSGGWNGGTDSFYEYLIKMYLYDSERFRAYKERWVTAIDSSIKYLASHPTSRPDLTFLAAYAGKDNLSFVSSHLACFDGGNFILGGLALDRQDYVDFGLALVDGCHNIYTSTATGIGPEVFRWQDSKLLNASNNPAPPLSQSDFYAKSGFWITNSIYDLRPEVIESYYYAYRATGNSKYQDWAWEGIKNINASCSVGVGLSAIDNVNAANGGGYLDSQESFLFAEVLKYSYLIQANQDDPWQVSATHNNEWVYNTEAHPFKVAGKAI